MSRPGTTAVGSAMMAMVLVGATLVARPALAKLTDEEKCQQTIAKEASKYVRTRSNVLAKCNNSLLKAKDGFNDILGAGCRDVAGKSQEKLDKATSKLRAAIDKKCGGDDKTCGTADPGEITPATIGWPAVCPLFEGGCSGGIGDCADIADCLTCIHDAAADQAIDLYYLELDDSRFGASSSPDKEINKCQKSMVKEILKFLQLKEKIQQGCWDKLRKGKDGFSSNPPQGCVDASGKTTQKIAKAESKKIAKICKKCGGPDKDCDDVVTPVNPGTPTLGGSGGGDDLDPNDIGFITTCPDVTTRLGVFCGGPIATLADLVFCLDCVTEFKIDCTVAATAPEFEAYPSVCNPACGDGVVSGAEQCDPPGSATCVNSGNGLEVCAPDCTCRCPGLFEFLPDPNDPNSLLDAGWTGVSHDVRFTSDAKLTVAVDPGSCELAHKPCGTCGFTGPVPNVNAGAGDIDNQRCRDDTSIRCGADTDCPTGPCVFFFGPAQPCSAGGLSTCTVVEIAGPVTGTANIANGESAGLLNARAHVFVPGAPIDEPCPRCDGDGARNDGTLGGTCSAGARDGLPCDANGAHPIPAYGSTSLDCPPAGIPAAVMSIPLDFSTDQEKRTLSAVNPPCSALGFTGSRCFCDTCNNTGVNPPPFACGTNADCAPGGICGGLRCLGGTSPGTPCGAASDCPGGGICGVDGTATRPNACTGGTPLCTATANNEGECPTGPFDSLCGPTETFRACAFDSDCPFAGDTCGFQTRECFLDNGVLTGMIVADGQETPPMFEQTTPTLASIFCIPPTTSAALNDLSGFPGPGRLTMHGTGRGLP